MNTELDDIAAAIDQLSDRRTAIYQSDDPPAAAGELTEIRVRLDNLYELRNARRAGAALTDDDRDAVRARAKNEAKLALVGPGRERRRRTAEADGA